MKSDREQFVTESLQTRDEFVTFINNQPWDTKLRVQAENILIIYDQAIEYIKKGEILNNGNHDNNQSKV